MKHEEQLKLQSFLDGELSEVAALEVSEWLTRDDQAAALLDELTWTKKSLAGNEVDAQLTETREFYWSKIARAIERQEATPVPARPQFSNWLRWLVPVSGMAAVAVLLMFTVHPEGASLNETEGVLEDTSVFTFQSQPEKMSVIWVQSEANQEFTTPTPDAKVDRNDNN